MLFFLMISFVVTVGFLINYFLFNSNTVSSETINPSLDRALDTSFLFNVTLYMSRFIETKEPFEINLENEMNTNIKETENLWDKQNKMPKMSRYFSQTNKKNVNFSWTKNTLSKSTDEYNLSLMIKNVQYYEAPQNAFVRFTVDSNYQQIVHFFKWEYWNIWQFYDLYPTSYSKISGFVTPQKVSRYNKNITSGFKGPDSTKIFFKLIPTHYGNEIEAQNFEGYQVFVDEYQRGSTVNKRNMANEFTAFGERNSGFDLELVSSVGDTRYHVQVQRVKSIIETIAYIFGFIAGLIIVSHVLKNVLSKEEYFKNLDRECNTLFGSLETNNHIAP